jgi:glycosyltransferase involved in cell wall biosynthesis
MLEMTRIATIHYSQYPQDPRPRREAEALVDAGMPVDVICIRGAGQSAREVINGVTIHRLSLPKTRGGKLSYIMEYVAMFALASVKLSLLHMRYRFDIVHVHNMPDFLVFAAILPKLCGSRVILDLHDPMPELYRTKYALGEESRVIRLLKTLERWSIRFADLVLTPNVTFRNLFISRGCPEDKIHIIMNSPMEKVFQKHRDTLHDEPAKGDEIIMMFHGGIYERHGLGTALEALALLKDELPCIVFKVFGNGDYVSQFLALVDRYGLKDMVRFIGPVTHETIAKEIGSISFGIIPNKKSPFTDLNLPVRIFEYLFMGKPVIVPRTRGILDYFDEDSLFFFEPGDARSLADAIRNLCRDTGTNRQITARGMEICARYRWELQQRELVGLVDGLLGPDIVNIHRTVD